MYLSTLHSNIQDSSVDLPGKIMYSTLSHNKPFAHMACERWLHARLDDLRTKSVFNHRAEYEYLPQKLEKSFVDFNVKEKNIRGETLIMSVIRYELNKANQVRYINLLIRSGCDPSEPDERQLRTPLMLACLMRNDTVAHHLILQNVNLMAADKMGNTVLMYAAMYSQSSLLNFLVEELSRRWCIEAFRAKNSMGYTAESLARKNERYMFSMLLKKGRLRLVKRLRDQVSSNLMFAPPFNNWNIYCSIYKAKQKFLLKSQRSVQTSQNSDSSPVRNSKSSLPLLHGINSRFSQKNSHLKRNPVPHNGVEMNINLPPLSKSIMNASTALSGKRGKMFKINSRLPFKLLSI
uniref:ANK_REP_REGION domain-containing protein n=1 Tax=Elaeophora elaphi TaxID=1147741 RepID=A0A0R3S5L4_9BILA